VESAQKVDITMEYKMGWTDERLSWNPADYCGINEIYLSREDVWVPVASLLVKVSTENYLSSFRQFTTDYREDFQNRGLLHFGSSPTVAAPRNMAVAAPGYTIRQFPFDSQNCSIVMMAQSLSVRDYTMETDILPEIFSNIGLLGRYKLSILGGCGEELVFRLTFLTRHEDDIRIASPQHAQLALRDRIFGLRLHRQERPVGVFVVVNLALMVASLGLVLLLPYIRLPSALFINRKVGRDEKKLAMGGVDGSAENTKEIAPLLNVTLLILLELANLTNFLVLIL
ncbi:hypothetical protein OSTOST_10676, partial [Ostertagia ostertagi]